MGSVSLGSSSGAQRVHLKTLTLRGFKSFASSTTLRFEPGITCVVGPNGSGKSNVVDALAWVMGEQGAKSLRGGKMEDVIFAGTAGRAPLGRAEVQLTIDNTDGALPIDFTEVTISRTMFRNGGSEYAINGEPCRLLDIQELLSDSGIGREMHVIVGQGQLDATLSATPEDRRGFIEEAAGVLKHRKRKEKALRKLDAMEGNLTRVQDLTSELRRQLKPLGRQAEAARRAATIQADLRDARLRLLADDLLILRTTLDAEVADEAAYRQQRAVVEAKHAEALERETELQTLAQEQAPALAAAQETWFALSSLRERLRGTAELAAERVRLRAPEPEEERSVRDPDDMDAEAERIRGEERALAATVDDERLALQNAVAARQAAEAALADEERAVAAAVRAAADRREGLAKLAGQVNAARSRVETRSHEIQRLESSLIEARERAEHAHRAFTALETQVAGLDDDEVDLDAEHAAAADAFRAADAEVERLRIEEAAADRDRVALTARLEALELGLARKDGTGALLAAGEQISGLLGSVAALITVQAGYETALAAALGNAADAVAVGTAGDAVEALNLLKAQDAGRAGIVYGGPTAHIGSSVTHAPTGSVFATDLVSTTAPIEGALRALLRDVVVVDGLDAARSVIAANPALTAVTRDGDVVGRGIALGGSSHAPSLLEVQAAVDDCRAQLTDAQHRAERATFALTASTDARRDAQERVEAALTRLHESDARMAAVAEQLGQLGSQARAASEEADRIDTALINSEQLRSADIEQAEELEQRLAAAQGDVVAEPDTAQRDSLDQACIAARASEMEARLAVRTGEERVAALAGRAEQLTRAAREEREARERAAARRERRAREAAIATAVVHGAQVALARLEQSLAIAAEARTAAERAREARDAEIHELRRRTRELAAEIEQLTDVVHRDEVARAEQRLRIEQVESRAVEEYGVDAASLIAEYGPEQLVPPTIEPDAEPVLDDNGEVVEPQPYPFVRAQQEKRLKSAERGLSLLGRINPLALEEYAALEERLKFLTEQLEDLKNTKRDLLDIVREVDERVEQVFTEAYLDVEREFKDVFARLFPGGEGRLVLTDPANMLTTGVEIEARPPGKKVKRLSLLSGGERSLTAVAFLVALFKARPSPFYVMDEVEAALDDVNLQRLINVMEELRAASQLIIVTHQKRTMEIADALYGVSMRGDGVTTVISQRLRESEEGVEQVVDVTAAVPAPV
jgi:chromosome segregation protein